MKNPSIDRYINEFAKVKTFLPGSDKTWLREMRYKAIAHFTEIGFPTRKDEEWKYTSVKLLENANFTLSSPNKAVKTDDLQRHLADDVEAYRIVLINGKINPVLSDLEALPASINLSSLAQAIEQDDPIVKKYLSTVSKNSKSFSSLNLALFSDGVVIEAKANTVLDKPIHILHINTEANNMSHFRHLIKADDNCELTLIESFLGLHEEQYLTNGITEVIAGNNTHFHHYRLQQEGKKSFHVSELYVSQEKDSQVHCHSFSFGGAVVRSDTHVMLEATGAHCSLNGLYLGKDNQHVDHHTTIAHNMPHTTSYENYKGVLSDKAKSVFNGKVIVAEDAQKTNAHQSNKNLLLSKQAEANTAPQLEIYADDVKCAHGATVGQLDDNALFYLRSRGIDDATARHMLTLAFAKEVADAVTLPGLKTRLLGIISNQIGLKDVDYV